MRATHEGITGCMRLSGLDAVREDERACVDGDDDAMVVIMTLPAPRDTERA